MVSSEQQFNFVIYGELLPGKSKQEVLQNLARLLKTSPQKIEHLLNGKRVVVKRGIDKETGLKYLAAFKRCGALGEVEYGADPEKKCSS